ncbi:MAG: cysteine--tRNA ligase [Oligoflexia bacterium]|nr:cysteine--tRNA ligase [Oligoflexia bacterium]
MIKIYNSLSRKKEDFVPYDPGDVKMYACGITPYDEAHVGHAMQAIVFDTIRRYLEFSGYKVTYVRNFTDVDDKIIEKARREGVDPLELSSRYVESSKRDLAAIRVRPGDHEPLVSGHINDIINFISVILEKGHAYPVNGSVYFDVASFRNYGRLSGRNTEELECEEGDGSEKKSPHDFALWKAAKPDEISWESPWGRGRPGWHIECSVMATVFLGDSIDIHGGGMDIIFPHHENEIAQSEAYSGKQFAKYWMHNGLLMVGKQKMSKSLGNFYTIAEALEKFGPDVIRYMILSFAYSSNVNFQESNLLTAEKRVHYYYTSLKKLNMLLNDHSVNETLPNDQMAEKAASYVQKLRDAMDDNFNTAQALAVMNELFTDINTYTVRKKQVSKKGLKSILESIGVFSGLFSLFTDDPGRFIEEYRARVLKRLNMNAVDIDNAIQARNAARKDKEYRKADDIRAELLQKGIAIMDNPDGSTDWSYDPV